MQPAKGTSRDDLAPALIGAGQNYEQLSFRGVSNAVEPAQLSAEGRAQIGERLRGEILAVGVRETLDVVQAHEQAAERGAMARGSLDLFVQARGQLYWGEAVARSPWRAVGVLGVCGSHADRSVSEAAVRGGYLSSILDYGLISDRETRGPSVCAGTPVRVLNDLRVENLLLIERAELALAPGLNVLTGETGAGKTVLAHALDLLMGGAARPGRSRTGIVRPDAEEAYVEGSFSVPESVRDELAARLPENIRVEDDLRELILARRVYPDGRTRAYLNGRSAAVGDLRDLGARLISFYGQHEHRKLVLASAQLQMLDEVGGHAHARRLQACAASYRQTCSLEAELARLAELEQGRERELELVEHELGEIESAAPDEHEYRRLVAQRERLRSLEALRAAAGAASDALAPDSPEQPGAAHLLAAARARLEAIAGLDPDLDALAQRCAGLAIDTQDLAGDLRGYCEQAEAQDGSLEAVEERLALLERVLRKYGGSISAALDYAEQAQTRRAALLGATVTQENTARLLASERVLLDGHVQALRGVRRKAAKRLAAGVRDELAALAMQDATFEIALSATEPKANGGDAAEFTIAPNPGVAAAPLREIASGGELSRVMLALTSASNGGAGFANGSAKSTLVFDEIDAGIGGHTARAVGERLQSLAADRQVLCITHLPQIASLAARHFSVAKDTSADPTVTTVERLAEGEVVNELMRMLGADEQDGAARRHARELLRAV
jgi:DNA repair protein RecN (Recombination protein N)